MVKANRLNRSSVRRATAGALLLAFAACGADGDAAEQSATEEQGIGVEAAPGASLLARTSLSPTHRVEFWQGEDEEVAVIEDYAPDSGEQSALRGFRGESYADLYQKLAGTNVEPAVVARLRAVDARPRKATAAAQNHTAAELTSEPSGVSHANTKSVSEDSKFFLEQICQPRAARIHPDKDLCWTQSLQPGWKEVKWVQTGWYLFQGSLFNAAFSGDAEFVVSNTNPRLARKITASPRRIVGVNLTSDNGFAMVGRGESFAIYYSFID